MRHKMNYKYLLFLLSFVFVLSASAQDTLTLEQAIETALQNNFSIRIQRNDIAIAKNNNTVFNAGFLPSVTASGVQDNSLSNSHQAFFDGRVRDVSGAKGNSLSGSVMMNWTVFQGFNMFIAKESLQKLQMVEELESRIVIENTVSAVITTYYSLVSEQKRRQVYAEAVSLSRARKELVDYKLQLGAASQVDVYQATVDYNADTTNLIREEALIAGLKSDLNNLLARDPQINFNVSNSIPFNNALKYEEILQKSQNENSQLYLARRNQELSHLNVKFWQSQFFPSISLYAGLNYLKLQSQVGLLASNRTYGPQYGIRANFNLFNGFETNRNYSNAKLQQYSSQIRSEQMKNDVVSDLYKLYNSYKSALAVYDLEKGNVEVARKNTELSYEKYKLGTIDNIDFRATQQKLIDAENRFLISMYQAKAAETELMRLSGDLWADMNK